jgi:hypothetical protein
LLFVPQESGELQQIATVNVSRKSLGQDSTKYDSAVLYSANVFGFLVSFVSSRYSATAARCRLWHDSRAIAHRV